MHVESLHRYARPQIGMFSDWLAGSFFGVDGTNKFPVDTGFSESVSFKGGMLNVSRWSGLLAGVKGGPQFAG